MDYKKYFKRNSVKVSDRQFVAIKLGGLITAARLHSNFSQAELARAIGTQQPSLARAEKGEVAPSVEFLYKIAKALKTGFVFPKFGFMEERERTSEGYFRFDTKKGLQPHTPINAVSFQPSFDVPNTIKNDYQTVK